MIEIEFLKTAVPNKRLEHFSNWYGTKNPNIPLNTLLKSSFNVLIGVFLQYLDEIYHVSINADSYSYVIYPSNDPNLCNPQLRSLFKEHSCLAFFEYEDLILNNYKRGMIQVFNIIDKTF